MKSFVFCTSYVEENGTDTHAKRYSKWIGYYRALLDELGASHLFLIDDGSERSPLAEIAGVGDVLPALRLPEALSSEVNVVAFPDHLGRQSVTDYRGWWRSFSYAVVLAEQYHFDKIIHIESDFYILSPRLRSYLRDIETGWTSLYSAAYNFPETAIQVICRDCYPRLRTILDQAREQHYYFGKEAENVLPFTNINKNFTGDRIGEFPVFRQWSEQLRGDPDVDYVGQLLPDVKILSSGQLTHLLHAFSERTTGVADEDIILLKQLLFSNDLLLGY